MPKISDKQESNLAKLLQYCEDVLCQHRLFHFVYGIGTQQLHTDVPVANLKELLCAKR